MHKRSVAFLLAILFAFSGISVRLMQLTTNQTFEAAGVRSTLTVTVATKRGTIYDRHLQPFTDRSTRYAAVVVPFPETIAALSKALPTEEWATLRERLQDGKPVVVTTDTPLPSVTGIRQFVVSDRYDDDTLASHTLGYLDSAGVSGVSGVERAYDSVLVEATGSVRVTYQTDGTGAVLAGAEVTVDNTLSRANAGIALTLDRAIQHRVERVAGEKITKGAVVVMDPSNGDILALASFPNFQASRVSEYLQREDSPLFNRTMAVYNCGSVFKTVSAMVALENGVLTTQTHNCVGAETVGSNRIRCHQVLGHGELDMRGGYLLSCNPYFIRLMQLVGAAPLYRLASLLGFDSPIPLANGYLTARATMPSEAALEQETVLANVSFGQGDLLASPIHISQLTACVVNGGVYYRPNLYAGSVNADGVLTPVTRDPAVTVCSSQTASILREMMIGVVEEGSGMTAQPLCGGAGGKTGTAQTGWAGEDGKTMIQNWFSGFYPAENPRYVVTVLIEDSGKSGESAAPVFAAICDELYKNELLLNS